MSSGMMETLKIFGANMGLSDTDPRIIFARLVHSAMGFVGIIMVVMILWSGWLFMTSGGNDDQVKRAKMTFFNAIIGLAIILSAYSIVAFALKALSAANS